MAINPHDDYESLAKLLYPSIEASGNVYYGQTRKLAIDELFDKNNNGFESYFCSYRKEDDNSQYKEHFHWKLGPFSDTVKIVDIKYKYKTYPVAWLEYNLTKKETEHTNVINDGKYSTYDVEYTLGRFTLYCSLEGLLPNGDMYDGRNFFLDLKGDSKVLYILLYKAPVYEDMDKPLYIEALTDDIEISLQSGPDGEPWPDGWLEHCNYKFGPDYNDLATDLPLNSLIYISKGNRVYIRCEDRPKFSDYNEYSIQFRIVSENGNAKVAVGGNIESMTKLDENGDILPFAYTALFYNNELITDASKLYIGKLSNRSCGYLFSKCARLKTAPAILPCLELKDFCYTYMFDSCVQLQNAPILPAKVGSLSCYASMFSIDSELDESLYTIACLLNPPSDTYTYEWLQGRSVGEIWIAPNSDWTAATLPNGCELYEISPVYMSISDILASNVHTEKYLVAHGTNNESNGRGDITIQSTLANMEKSFDENNSHPMNTYNSDGSFNQEIWGYKSFCSPVQFRNGIYGEDWSIYTYEYSNSINNTSLVMSRDESQSASIQICEGRADDMRKYSIILSGRKPVDDYLSSDGAIVEISNIRTRVSEHFPYYTRGFITLQANQIQLNGTTKADSITSDTVTADSITSDTVTADSTTSDVIYNATIYTSEISTMAQTANININCDITSNGDIIVDNGKKFIGDLDGVIPYVDFLNFNNVVPVGCIVFLRVEYNDAPSVGILNIGVQLSSNHYQYDLYIGCFNDTGLLGVGDTANNKLAGDQFFRTLSRGQCVNNIAHVLAIRVD